MISLPAVHGLCPPRFAAVKDAFAANFTEAPEGLNEQAARFSVCVEGEVVVERSWNSSTNVSIGCQLFHPLQ